MIDYISITYVDGTTEHFYVQGTTAEVYCVGKRPHDDEPAWHRQQPAEHLTSAGREAVKQLLDLGADDALIVAQPELTT